jgi:hypothetical protein
LKTIKCPYCDDRYAIPKKTDGKEEAKEELYGHMEDEHEDQLDDISPAQVYFNYRNNYNLNKKHGECIIDKKPTDFNEKSERYNRLCSERCKKIYRERFKQRMMKKYGKEHLLNDPEWQRKLLANRKISGTYKFKDNEGNKHEFDYTGSYEEDFIITMLELFKWDPDDIIMPAPMIFKYISPEDNEEHFYIPDAYIPSLGGLVVEIKASHNTSKGYRERDKHIEKAKDKVVKESNYNYLKIMNKQYGEFLKYVKEFTTKI